MNEFSEHIAEIPPVEDSSQPPEHQDYSLDTVMNNAFKEFGFESVTDAKIIEASVAEAKEKTNIREYGLKECCDAAKNIFTKEVLSDWGRMSLKQREIKLAEYSDAVGKGLDINYKGIVYETMKPNEFGYNNGDGHVYLNKDLLRSPAEVINLIDTVTHEYRHQMQSEAMKNPEKFGLDQATLKEWKYADANYTQQRATALNPWGYHYNPLELDARYFGESVVRELTKGLINNA